MKKKIAIISILKPVNDPRNYKKIGVSLAETKKYEIHIIGFSASGIPVYPNIHFHPVFHFQRLSLKRITASWNIYKILLKVKPDAIISNTHETLMVTVLNKILFGTKILYDVQENYMKNIRYSQAFPPLFRRFLARFVRLKERLLAPFFDFFFLAEKCYERELNFIGKRYAVVENKYVAENISPPPMKFNKAFTITYTGTIAEEYGIFDALDFAGLLQEHIPTRLKITGYCPNQKTLLKLKEATRHLTYVEIVGADKPVAHDKIVYELGQADFAILPYRLNTYYSQRIPTKIYECLSLKKPMITRKNAAWQFLFDEFDAFVFTDFKSISPGLIGQLKKGQFYTKGDTGLANWNTEKHKVVDNIERVIGT